MAEGSHAAAFTPFVIRRRQAAQNDIHCLRIIRRQMGAQAIGDGAAALHQGQIGKGGQQAMAEGFGIKAAMPRLDARRNLVDHGGIKKILQRLGHQALP